MAIALPGIQDAKKSGNETSAISAMKTLVSTNGMHLNRYGLYAPSLNELNRTGFIDEILGAADVSLGKSGYVFSYNGSQYAWSCTASPLTPAAGARGHRSTVIGHQGLFPYR